MDWNDIKLKDYENLLNAWKTDKTRFSNAAIEYLFNIKNPETTLPLTEYAHYLNELKFFQTTPPKAKLKTSYTLNGTVYDVKLNMAELSAVQFQDYTIYSRQTNPSTIDLLSVVLIPHGKFYNDGYDIEKAKEDIGEMSVSDANAIVFFFASWFRRYVTRLNACLIRPRMMRKLPKATREALTNLTSQLREILSNMG